MRQRAMIALALACRPQLLLADEPTTALDATVQIQILLLLRELQRELGMSVIFVTHDIGVAVEVADRIAVMYAGRIVEEGPARDADPRAAPPLHAGAAEEPRPRRAGQGQRGWRRSPARRPTSSALPPGCAFAERCSSRSTAAARLAPELVRLAADHGARCLRTDATAESAIAVD